MAATSWLWYTYDLRTGVRQEQLPLVGSIAGQINAYTTSDLKLNLWNEEVLNLDVEWRVALARRKTLVVLTRQLPNDTVVDAVWAGVVLGTNAGAADEATIHTATPEYLAERHILTQTITCRKDFGDTVGTAVTAVLTDLNLAGWSIQADISGLTTPLSWSALVTDQKTAYAALNELAQLDGGPEWYIEPRWNGDETRVQLWLVARPRVGSAQDPTNGPSAVFYYPGDVVDYDEAYSEDAGSGGNNVVAKGSTNATVAASNATRIAAEGQWDTTVAVETAVDSTGLAAAASKELNRVVDGTVQYTMSCNADEAPIFRRDWWYGDDVRLHVRAADDSIQAAPSPGHPNGLNVVARAIGWSLDETFSVMTPTLWQPSEIDFPGSQ